MSKPRFPLSVERHFCFRAKLSTEEVIECSSFKALYNVVRTALRCEVFYLETEYKYAEAVFEFGYYTEYEIKRGYWYTEWTQIKDYGCLQISTLSEWWYSTEDESNHCIRGTES